MPQVVTGDAVVLDVQVAQLPVRAVSALIDLAAMVMITIVGLVLVGLTVSQLDSAAVQVFLLIFVILVPVLYPTIFETATRGRSLGKMAMGLRVVSDDGGPERFSQALFRALASVVEIWMLFGSPAVICSMLSPRGKRVGDVFAGTVVIGERGPRMAPPPMMPPALAWWAPSLQLSGLTPELADVARQFLGRAPQLDPGVRNQMAYRIGNDVVARIAPPPPPGAPPELVLAAVLAERHRRELVRLQPRAQSSWPAGPLPQSTGPSWRMPPAGQQAPPAGPVAATPYFPAGPSSEPTVSGPAASPPVPPDGDGLVPPG